MRGDPLCEIDTGSGRLGGGPKLPPNEYQWWTREMQRVAAHEGLARIPFTSLLVRIARCDMDLTHSGLQLYRSKLARYKKKSNPRNGSPPKK